MRWCKVSTPFIHIYIYTTHTREHDIDGWIYFNIRHFLQENLPRMQYNNPDVEFEVFKSADPATKPSVTVHFGE